VPALRPEVSLSDASAIDFTFGLECWSGGGSMTLNAMFRYADLCKTGISEGKGTTLHFYSLFTQYLSEHLPAVVK